jgi:hypothetical protein
MLVSLYTQRAHPLCVYTKRAHPLCVYTHLRSNRAQRAGFWRPQSGVLYEARNRDETRHGKSQNWPQTPINLDTGEAHALF